MGVARIAGLVAVALLGLPAAADAQGELPVGEAEGVRIVRERGAIVVVFTPHAKKLWRRVAGRRVSVLCTEFLGDGTAGGGATMRAPKRGRKIRTGDLTRGMDYCDVSLEPRRRGRSSKLVVSVPLTQRGAVFLDEREVARGLFGLLVAIDFAFEERGSGVHPTVEQVLTRFPQFRGHRDPAFRSGRYAAAQDHRLLDRRCSPRGCCGPVHGGPQALHRVRGRRPPHQRIGLHLQRVAAPRLDSRRFRCTLVLMTGTAYQRNLSR